MLVLDELKKNDPQLRLVAVMLAGGLLILLAGLWWVQVVSAREYQAHLDTQAYRTIRIPAVRGKILDREGRVLAENRPCYNLSLYLDDLRQPFAVAITQLMKQAHAAQQQAIAAAAKKLGRALTKAERKEFEFKPDYLEALRDQARDQVAAGVVADISRKMGVPLPFDAAKFNRHYATELAMPFPILSDLDEAQIARFEEKCPGGLGTDLELQSLRSYPLGTTAAHLLGELRQDDSSIVGEEAFFNYRLPDYRGVTGIEGKFDAELHGRAGEESVLVNNMGYRQAVDVDSQPQAGENVVLTLDLDIQRAAEQSLTAHRGADARAAIVVINVQTGDVLAMVSFPEFDPNEFAQGISKEQYDQIQQLTAEKNRATQENYAPGSIFKPVVALAALENGLDPNAIVDNPGYVYVGRRHIGDLAPPGKYNLRRAIMASCNTYFITIGLRTGIESIVRMGEKFHFGEREDLPTRQETAGIFPTLGQVDGPDWRIGDTANICIGQGQLAVTPMQMAVAYAAIANGGTVLWPRLVDRVEPQDPASGEKPTIFPAGVVRDRLGIRPGSLNILRAAMLAETEDPEGTGHAAVVGPQMRICGKTGTAQVMDVHNREIGRTTWFASFAPYEHPRYAVVVMVENGTYGGPTCAPIAHDIYEALLKKETSGTTKALANAK